MRIKCIGFEIKRLNSRDAGTENLLFQLHSKLKCQRKIALQRRQDLTNCSLNITKPVNETLIYTCEKSINP